MLFQEKELSADLEPDPCEPSDGKEDEDLDIEFEPLGVEHLAPHEEKPNREDDG